MFLPGEPQGQMSLVGYSPWGRKESDMAEETENAHTEKKYWADTYVIGSLEKEEKVNKTQENFEEITVVVFQ